MTTKTTQGPLLKADTIRASEQSFSHPLNPNSQITGSILSRLCGLTRTGVSLVRIPPGKESFIYHTHLSEEEWIYILSGRGIAEIDDTEHEVGPGDFMGFPAPSVGHHLRNPFAEELVYLMGGESREVEVADFPRLGKRAVRHGMNMTIYPLASGEPLMPGGAKPNTEPNTKTDE